MLAAGIHSTIPLTLQNSYDSGVKASSSKGIAHLTATPASRTNIFWAEVANVLCTGVCRHRWSSLIAEQTASHMRRRDFPTVPSLMLFSEALEIALTQGPERV